MIGLLVSRESVDLPFTIVIILLTVIGILMSVQMGMVLGRFSGQNRFLGVAAAGDRSYAGMAGTEAGERAL